MGPSDIPFKQKKRMMLGLTLGNYLSASLSTAMVAFYADFAQQRYPDAGITDTKVGLVLGMLEGAGLVSSPFFKSFLGCVGRKNGVILGLALMFISNTALGCIGFLDESHGSLFFTLSLVIRFIMGLGDALVLTTNNAIVCLAWGDQKAKYLGMMLGGSGLGTITAPVIGGLIFSGFKKYG